MREPKIWNKFLGAPHCYHVGAVQPLGVGIELRDDFVRFREHLLDAFFVPLLQLYLQLLFQGRQHLAPYQQQFPLHPLQRLGLQALRLVDDLHLGLPARAKDS